MSLMLAGCSRAPENPRDEAVAVRGGRAMVVAAPSAAPSPVATTAPPLRHAERKAFVDPPLPPELVNPPGLAPLPTNPPLQGEGDHQAAVVEG
ncbi:hypothetical protein [Sphingomonas jinjuensis]|uniref:hypothetical protein n=1 Tax=Sphingomonas jinjuensis TaxID=535907 RepID=UPI001C84A62D|nr:hypothetical protein [Sphingomonas jinjuensis]